MTEINEFYRGTPAKIYWSKEPIVAGGSYQECKPVAIKESFNSCALSVRRRIKKFTRHTDKKKTGI